MTATTFALLLAVLAQGAIALVLLAMLGNARLPLIGRGEIRVEDVALSNAPWPENAQRVSRTFDNQFQLPVLLYVAAGLALYLGPTLLDAVLAWLFVISRVVHAAIYVVNKHVHRRFAAFAFGYGVLCVLWLALIARLVILAFGSP